MGNGLVDEQAERLPTSLALDEARIATVQPQPIHRADTLPLQGVATIRASSSETRYGSPPPFTQRRPSPVI
jgi:hypothetical protein